MKIGHLIHRPLITLLVALSVASATLVAAEVPSVTENSKIGATLVYIGTYTGKKSEGIYVSRLDPETGEMSAPELAAVMSNPSWLAIRPNGKFLYAAGEFGPFPGGGAIRGFSIAKDGKLTAINTQEPGGLGPCHLAINPFGKTIVTSNYSNGSVSALAIAESGELLKSIWTDEHPTLGGKKKPHAHCTEFDPSGRFALTCDAGIDRIYVYRYDSASGELKPNNPPFAETAAGSHPRHLAFSPDGKFCYSINEAAMSVTAFSFDASSGVLHEIQTISTLPADFKGKAGSTAEMVMHPSGKFLYGSNRGPSNIVGYSVDAHTGKLTLIGHTPTGGEIPRGFGIDPTGRWLIAGNQASDSVVEFKIDQSTGELLPTGAKFEVGAPVCIQFLEQKPIGSGENKR